MALVLVVTKEERLPLQRVAVVDAITVAAPPPATALPVRQPLHRCLRMNENLLVAAVRPMLALEVDMAKCQL
jgi:hypothetical protein